MKFIPKKSSSNLIHSYNKQILKLKRSIESGRFAQWSYQKRQYLIARILQLLKSIRSHGVKVAGTLGLALLGSLSVNAQFGAPITGECESSVFDDITLAPFNGEGDFGPAFYSRQALSGDLDNDGDEDLLVISYEFSNGYFLQYFDNDEGEFVELVGEDNPLEIFNDEFSDSEIPPFFNFSLGDATLNGRLDLVLGESKGEIICYINTEEGFVESIEGDKDIESMDEDRTSTVLFANIDDDCDIEAISVPAFGGTNGDDEEAVGILVFDNVNGTYVESPEMASMFENINLEESNEEIDAYFFDINGDGLEELIIVRSNFSEGGPLIELYSKVEGTYEAVSDEENPFDGIDFSEETGDIIPLFDFGDLDGDGNLNMYLGFKSNSAVASDEILCFESTISVAPACVDPADAVPTLSEWGLIILSLIFLIFGIVGIKEKKVRTLVGLKPKKDI